MNGLRPDCGNTIRLRSIPSYVRFTLVAYSAHVSRQPALASRRQLLQAMGIVSTGFLLANRAGASVTRHRPTLDRSTWVHHENLRSGDSGWLRGPAAPAGTLEGYTNSTSVNIGETLSVFVSTMWPTYAAKIYRMGYYQGHGARLVDALSALRGEVRATPRADQYGTVDCNWPVSFLISMDKKYLPGQYLIRLEAPSGEFAFVPFLVRDDSSRSTFVYMSSVTTWQAYNTWGGLSLYRGADPLGTGGFNNATRAVRVSFNRPYDRSFANGAADFIGNEFPLLYLAEKLSLDLTYITDVDLHVRGKLLENHRALLSLGHDEYYTPAMREAVTNAIDAGVNVAIFGANFCYRKIRFEDGVNGANRLMVNYRSTADPINAVNSSLTTVNWSQPPSNAPSSSFTGSLYGGVNGTGSLRVEDASSWLWRGTGLADGAVLPGALGAEFNRYYPNAANPPNVQILGHSPVAGGTSDITYVAQPGRGGVFCSGTGQWIFHLSNAPLLNRGWVPGPSPGVTRPLTIATENILHLFAQGPAGTTMPSVANTSRFY